jgi:two-component system, chemotaxis family, chemotaxis protein CheY
LGEPHHHRVLLVDDDVDILDAFGTLLTVNGVDVDLAHSAFAALGKLQSGPTPCLVLLDIRMPGMSGWDLWNWMQREPTTAGVPVVMISGDGYSRTAAQSRGVLDVLLKPVDVNQVLQLIERHCSVQHAAPA